MRYLIIILLFACYLQAPAQFQNNNWIFGAACWLNFNTTPPTTTASGISAVEGCAVISNKRTGDLLFYTDGVKVYDRTHHEMPNGGSVGTDITHDCVQSSLIIPSPSDTNKYYVFTMDNTSSAGCFRYSVVDMRLAGGLGDVEASHNGILIDCNFTEALTSVNVCNTVWIATIKRGTNDFCLYKLDENGVNTTPVISPKAYPRGSNGTISIKISRDKQRLAVAAYNGVGNISYLALHDIDLKTGLITNGKIIDSAIGKYEFYSCEFSPSGKRLFASLHTSWQICQYDVSLPTAGDINKSRTVLFTAPFQIGALQMGPDNCIYVCYYSSVFMDKIVNTDLMSPGCKYYHNAVTFSAPSQVKLGLPQLVFNMEHMGPISAETYHDSTICFTDSVILRAEKGHATYVWSNSDNADTMVIKKSGTYWVKATDSCFERTDTFNITILPYQYIDLGNDTAICEGMYTVFKNHYPNVPGSQFLWSTGSTDSAVTINQKGTYWLTITQGNCPVSDTINIITKPFPIVDIGKDTTICTGTNITLHCNPQNFGVIYKWSNGSIDDMIQTQGPGVYSLTVDQKGCTTTQSVTVGNMPVPFISLGGNVDTCYPYGISLPNGVIKGVGYKFLWNTGSTDSVMFIDKEGFYKVQLTNVCGVATDSIVFKQHNCKIWLPNAFSPNGDGRNDVWRLQGDVKGITSFDVMIYNRWGQCVYRSNNPYEGWDGTQKGQPCETGTYYYLMHAIYNRKQETWKDGVELVR